MLKVAILSLIIIVIILPVFSAIGAVIIMYKHNKVQKQYETNHR